MNPYKALSVALGFVTILGIYAGYWIGASKAKAVFDSMNFLLTSERNTETIQNIKALSALREKQIDVTLQFMEVRVKGALDSEGIKSDAIALAKEYQRKYCKTACLGTKEKVTKRKGDKEKVTDLFYAPYLLPCFWQKCICQHSSAPTRWKLAHCSGITLGARTSWPSHVSAQ